MSHTLGMINDTTIDRKMIDYIDDSKLWMCFSQWLGRGPVYAQPIGFGKDGMGMEADIGNLCIEVAEALDIPQGELSGMVFWRDKDKNTVSGWHTPGCWVMYQNPEDSECVIEVVLTIEGNSVIRKHFYN